MIFLWSSGQRTWHTSFRRRVTLTWAHTQDANELTATRPVGNRSESATAEVPSENGEAIGAGRETGRLGAVSALRDSKRSHNDLSLALRGSPASAPGVAVWCRFGSDSGARTCVPARTGAK